MRLAVIWDWKPSYEQAVTWNDGLVAALVELQKRRHTVDLYADIPTTIKHPNFDIQPIELFMGGDVILHFADFTRPHAKPLKELGIPMAICFTGGELFSYNTDLFDHIFVESEIYEIQFKDKGYSVSRAFGTNTELFKPLKQKKVFDTIFPATFAAWKRHELYAQATRGLKSLAVGYMYHDHEQECWQVCQENGVMIMPHVSAEALRYLYAASKVCVIPSQSVGGSQRTVLEAMAMDIPVVVADSDKFDFAQGKVFEAEPYPGELRQMIDSAMDAEVNTREYVLEHWSEKTYADSLETGLLALL